MSQPYDGAPDTSARKSSAPHPITQHLAWLKQYLDGMNESNWKDMRLRAERQLESLSEAIGQPQSPQEPVAYRWRMRSAIDPSYVSYWSFGAEHPKIPEGLPCDIEPLYADTRPVREGP